MVPHSLLFEFCSYTIRLRIPNTLVAYLFESVFLHFFSYFHEIRQNSQILLILIINVHRKNDPLSWNNSFTEQKRNYISIIYKSTNLCLIIFLRKKNYKRVCNTNKKHFIINILVLIKQIIVTEIDYSKLFKKIKSF